MINIKYYLITAILIVVTINITACNTPDSDLRKQQDDKKPEIMQNKDLSFYYTCPMHPEIKKDKPGLCPICEMNLVKKEKDIE